MKKYLDKDFLYYFWDTKKYEIICSVYMLLLETYYIAIM